MGLPRKLGSALLVMLAIPAFGQAISQAMQLEEIIITAEKRTADLQSTPIAISAYSQRALDDYGIVDVRDLTRLVPTLELAPVATGAVYFALRGVGNESPLAGGDNGVAPHFDGVYVARPAATLVSLFDVERVEVLRGPQGTLYGRNATGGVINVISNKPEDEFSGNVDLTLGDYDLVRGRGMVNIPLNDDWAARFAGTITRRDGYQENLHPGGDEGDDDESEFLRASLAYDSGGDFRALFTGTYSKIGGAGPQPVLGNTEIPVVPVAFIPLFPSPDAPIVPILFNPNNVTSNPSDPRRVNSDDTAKTDFDVAGLTATLEWDLDNFAFKSITGYYENKVAPQTGFDQYSAIIPNPADPNLPPFTFFIPPPPGTNLPPTPVTDGTPFDFLIGRSTGLGISFINDSKQFSQEFTLASASDGPLEWMTGLYFFREEINFLLQGDALPHLFFTPLNPNFAGLPAFGLLNSADFEASSYAVFGSGSYVLNDAFKLRAGLRYNYDEKEADLIEHVPVSGIVLAQDSPNDDWSAVTGNIGMDWFVAENHMLYASVSRGYKAGAINLVSSTDNIVDPEYIWSYEIGSKSRFFEERLQLNAALFFSEYEDLQVNFFESDGIVLRNADSAEILGLEVDVIAIPTDYLTITGAFAWTDAEYTKFVTDDPFTGQQAVDLEGNRLNQTPEFAFNIGAQLALRLAPDLFSASLHIDYTWKDEIDYQAFNTELTRSDSFAMTNVRLRLESPTEASWSIELYVNNIEDEDAVQSIQLPPTLSPANSANPLTAVHYRPPQTYGITVGYSF